MAPFTLNVKFDDSEVVDMDEDSTSDNPGDSENNGAPSGNTGFFLDWAQSNMCA